MEGHVWTNLRHVNEPDFENARPRQKWNRVAHSQNLKKSLYIVPTSYELMSKGRALAHFPCFSNIWSCRHKCVSVYSRCIS